MKQKSAAELKAEAIEKYGQPAWDDFYRLLTEANEHSEVRDAMTRDYFKGNGPETVEILLESFPGDYMAKIQVLAEKHDLNKKGTLKIALIILLTTVGKAILTQEALEKERADFITTHGQELWDTLWSHVSGDAGNVGEILAESSGKEDFFNALAANARQSIDDFLQLCTQNNLSEKEGKAVHKLMSILQLREATGRLQEWLEAMDGNES